MANYQLRIKKTAEKELATLPIHTILAIRKHILVLIENPFPAGYKKLKGFKNLYRIRSGDYRIIYTIHQHVLIIEVLQIVHRKDAYQ